MPVIHGSIRRFSKTLGKLSLKFLSSMNIAPKLNGVRGWICWNLVVPGLGH